MLKRTWKSELQRFLTVSLVSLKVIFVIISNSSATPLPSFQRKLQPLNSIYVGTLTTYCLPRREHSLDVTYGSCPPSPLLPPRLFVAISIGVNQTNRQIVVRFRQFPAAFLFAFEGGLIREKLLSDLGAVAGGGLVLVGNHDAVFPSRVFTCVKPWPVNCKGCYVTQLLLAVENGDLILLEDLPEFIGVSPFHLVNPLDQIGFVAWGNKRTGRSLLGPHLQNTGDQND